MAFDAIGIGEVVDSLFFGGDILAEAAPAALDLGAAAADVGAVAADTGLAAGTAADIGAAAAPALTDLGTTGADLGAAGATEAASSALENIPADVGIAAAGDLGTNVGLPNALEFAPTPADAAATTEGLGVGSAPGTSAGIAAGPSAANVGSVSSPVSDLAAGPENLNAALGTPSSAPVPEATTAQSALAGSPMSEVSASANAPAIGQLAAEGGLSPDTQVALAQAGGASAAAPSSSIGDSLAGVGSTLKGIASNPLVQMGLPAAMLGYNLLKGPAPIPPQANQAIANAENQLAPLQNAATQNVPLFNATAATDLNLANAFKISPAQAASIDLWKQNQYNALRQQIANQNPGSPNVESSSEWVQGKNQIDQQALAQQTQMVNQLISTAFQAASAANAAVSTSANVSAQFDSLLMQAAQLQVQQDTNFQQAVGSALQAFGLIAGLNASRLNAANTNTPAAATG